MRRLTIVAWMAAALAAGLATGCSGGSQTLSTSGSGTGTGTGTGTGSSSTYSLGNGNGGGFQSGILSISNPSLSAGGTASVDATVVDQTGTLYTGTPVTVTFNSPCVARGLASIAASGSSTAGTTPGSVVTSTGSVSATYTAKGCGGADIITASATVGTKSLTATGTVTVSAATVGAIQFLSASPVTIGLKGTGLTETSTVIFKVVDSTGGARPGVKVTFSLNTTVGGLNLSPTTATSGNDGTVQTVVSSGTEHTAVRVTASIASPAVSTQSSVLTVTTGLPASAGFSIAVGAPGYSALACPNVEAFDVDGITVPITVRLSDRYNNPAPDGTAVAFNTNGGHVDGFCSTPSATGKADGTCTVNWTSANPRPMITDTPPVIRSGRATILATAIGEESFTDSNGNGYWDAGEPFANLGEPYSDINENGKYDSGEYFLDFNQNQVRDAGDGTFKGIVCTGNTSGSTCSTSTLAIGVSHLIVMSTSSSNIGNFSTVGFGGSPPTLTIAASPAAPAAANVGTLNFTVQDWNGNAMAAGTTVSVTADSAIGSVSGTGASWTIGCDGGLGGQPLSVNLTAGTTKGSVGNLTITVTSPSSHTASIYPISVTLQ